MESLEFSIDKIMSSANRQFSFFFSDSDAFYFFFLLKWLGFPVLRPIEVARVDTLSWAGAGRSFGAEEIRQIPRSWCGAKMMEEVLGQGCE